MEQARALSRAVSVVISRAQTLQQDHAAGAQKATAVATQLGVNPPTELNKNQKAMHASLGKLSGQAFDWKFASEMVKDHKKEIAEYQKAAKKQGDRRMRVRLSQPSK